MIDGTNVPALLIGDSAFKLAPNLMKPYPFKVDMSNKQILFNKRLSSCRRVVENAFGHLEARFRKLGRGLEVNIIHIIFVTNKTIILIIHGFQMQQNKEIREIESLFI